MTAGVTTPNLTPTALADSLVVNRGGNTFLQTLAALGAQLSASGAIATALAGISNRLGEVELEGQIFETQSDGVAATAPGEQFRVRSSDPQITFRVYERGAGSSSSLIAEVPSVSYLSDLSLRASSIILSAPAGFAFAICDAFGGVAVGLRNDGTLEVSRLNGKSVAELLAETANAGALVDAAPAGYVWSLLDAWGKAAVGLRDTGAFAARAIEATTLNGVLVSEIIAGGGGGGPAPQPRHFPAEHNGVDSYGQSLSVGADAVPPITITQRFDNLRFNGGIRSQDSTPSFTSLVPLIETQVSNTGETPIGGATDMIKERLQIEDGLSWVDHTFKMIGTASGSGGTQISGLVKGTGSYNRLINNVQQGYNLSQAGGMTYAFNAFFWTQGESDYINSTPAATYKTAYKGLRADIDADVKAITGQSDPVICISYQVNGHMVYGHAGNPYIAVAQLEASREDDHIHIACPLYWSPQTVHQSAANSKILGAYYGLAYKRLVINREDWKPLQPLSVHRQGTIITLQMHVPTGNLVLDTATIAGRADYGFSVVNSGGSAVAISSVEVTGPNTVKIVTASAAAGGRIRYGFTNGGNLRDQQGQSIVFDGGGLDHPMHNWCVVFNEPLN